MNNVGIARILKILADSSNEAIRADQEISSIESLAHTSPDSSVLDQGGYHLGVLDGDGASGVVKRIA